MNDTTSSFIPTIFAEAIALAAAGTHLPKSERMKQHRINLRLIGFNEGLEGIKRYRVEHPDCGAVQVRLNSLAYMPKPKGYNAVLVSFAERWLCSSSARSTTNTDDVRALNELLGTNYPPGKHFSEPLSAARRTSIKAVFSRHGIPFDIKTIKTMSGVKAAARAARALMDGERRLGSAGVISGNTLVISGQPFTVIRNGRRECIRVMIGEARQRMYLDQIEWLADLLEIGGVDPLSTTTVRSMRDEAYPAKEVALPPELVAEIPEVATVETCDADPLELDW